MKTFLLYMTESAIGMSVLLLFYRYLYFKMAYFEWSRLYLAAAVFISLILPAVPVPEILQKSETGLHLLYSEGFFMQYKYNSGGNFGKLSDIILTVIFLLWLSGSLFFAYRLFKSLQSISKLKALPFSGKEDGFILHQNTASDTPTFSFFNHIFLGKKFNTLPPEDKKYIIEHEKQHGKMRHSIDRLAYEFYRVLFWFNPFTRLLILSVKEVHEFSADSKVTGNKFSQRYAELLLRMSSDRLIYPTGSSFSQKDQLKHRLQLISNPEPNHIRKKRFAVSLPILGVSIGALLLVFLYTNAVLIPETRKKSTMPIKKDRICAQIPFFENMPAEKVIGKNSVSIYGDSLISHRSIDYKTKGASEVFAVKEAVVKNIDTVYFQSLPEIRLRLQDQNGYEYIYEKLASATVHKNKAVKEGELIGFTGDTGLYPIFTFKVKLKDVYINPEKIWE